MSAKPIIDRPFEEASYNDVIDYPFKHWSKTRYSDGSYGVWYGTDTLEDTGWQDVEGIVAERKVYLVRCYAALAEISLIRYSNVSLLR